MTTPNKQSTIRLRAVSLPSEVVSVLESNSEVFKLLDKHWNNRFSLQEFSCLGISNAAGEQFWPIYILAFMVRSCPS